MVGDQVSRIPVIGGKAVSSEEDVHIALSLLHRAFQPLVDTGEKTDDICLIINESLDTVLRDAQLQVGVVIEDLSITVSELGPGCLLILSHTYNQCDGIIIGLNVASRGVETIERYLRNLSRNFAF